MANSNSIEKNPIVIWCQNLLSHRGSEWPPFDQVLPEHFVPARKWAQEQTQLNLKSIKENSAAANFDNTIVALETAGQISEMISLLFSNIQSAEGPDSIQALAPEMAQLDAAIMSEIALDEKIFQKVKAVYDQKNALTLNSEQQMLLDKTYKSFVRNGALLSSSDKEKLRAIDQELSTLAPKFSDNARLATNAYELWIENKSDLAGLPESVIESAAIEAKQKGRDGHWLFTLQAPSYIPFLTYADNAKLRQKIWFASSSKCTGGSYDNSNVLLKTVELREKRSRLLGFKNHAEFILQERMAETPEKVFSFLQSMVDVSKSKAKQDLAEVQDFKKSMGDPSQLEPWDMAYYSEKLKEQKFKFNSEELRPYFQLEKVIRGAFMHAEKLYGLKFEKRPDIPTYHADVEVYKVSDSSGKDVGLFYTDFFPRPNKRSGAWMTSYRSQGLVMGQVRRPHISIVCNFTKPTESKPSLLRLEEVETLFHEFGHALHGLLSNVHYSSMASPNVYWDFVELPSQIMENWVHEKEALDLYASHFESGEKIPESLVQKIKDSGVFQASIQNLRQMQLASLDMAWHTTDVESIRDPLSFEEKATREFRLFPYVEGTGVSCNFSHIFAGGYSAGYYSYKWAEVLDADAFEYFKEKGLFNQEVAGKFQNEVLSKGGSEHPMTLYKKFRGRDPDPQALLRRLGLAANKKSTAAQNDQNFKQGSI